MSSTNVFILINLAGGILVLGSYFVGLVYYSDSREKLWGGLVGIWRTIFCISMILATFGYLLFFYYMSFEAGLEGLNHRFDMIYHSPSILCALFLISSSMWMPFTVAYLNGKGRLCWIVGVWSLWVSALSLLLLALSLGFHQRENQQTIWLLGTIGVSYVAFHCTVLDAIIWTNRFTKKQCTEVM